MSFGNYDIVVFFIGMSSYLSTILLGVFTFGDAIFFHVMWHLFTLMFPDIASSTGFGDHFLYAATLMLSVRSATTQVFFCYRSWKYAVPDLMWVAVPTATIFTWIGTAVLELSHGDANWVRSFLGVSFAVMSLMFAYSTYKKALKHEAAGVAKVKAMHDNTAWSITTGQKFMLGCACAFGGFFWGMVNVGTPPIMLMAMFLNLPHPAIRGMMPFVCGSALISRFLLALLFGVYRWSDWQMYAAAILGGWAGLPVGIELAGFLTHDTMAFSSCWIIFFAAVGTAGVSEVWTMTAFATAGVSYLVFDYLRKKQRKKFAEQASASPPVFAEEETTPSSAEEIAEPSSPASGDNGAAPSMGPPVASRG